MTKQNNKRARRTKRRSPNQAVPSSAAIRYSGPAKELRDISDGIVVELRLTQSVASGATTQLNYTLNTDPSAADNWSEYSSSWGEYRVLAMTTQYEPLFSVTYQGVASTYGVGPSVHSSYHQYAAPATTNYATAWSVGDSIVSHVTKKSRRVWRMSEPREANFSTVASPATNIFGASYFADNVITGTTYGIMFITYLVQFRSRTK